MTLPSPAPPPLVQYDLLIEPVFRVRRRWPQPEFPIQNVPFRFGLRFTNKGEKPFPGCKFRDVHISGEATTKLALVIGGDYSLRDLKPRQSVKVWVSKENLPWDGPVMVRCNLVAPGMNIETYTRDPRSGDISKCNASNAWKNLWFVSRQMEVEQKRTNNLIMILTLLLVLEALFDVKQMRIDFLRWIAGVIGKVVH
ncbi:MAG TPA: hypothetical protein VGQ29_02455 [Gemmatimonadales bacterium]|jgi:hypothetical protein|nr:hypothetical protein [Gemmatimonadales bacterium]